MVQILKLGLDIVGEHYGCEGVVLNVQLITQFFSGVGRPVGHGDGGYRWLVGVIGECVFYFDQGVSLAVTVANTL